MKSNEKTGVFLILFSALFFIHQKAYSDGLGIEMGKGGKWEYFTEERQWALIKHEDGFQKMLLSVSIRAKEAGTLIWLFPVPAAPDKVAINITEELPVIYGDTVQERARKTLRKIQHYLFATQIYAAGIPTELLSGQAASLGADADSLGSGITIHEQIIKAGMVSELVTARDGAAIYAYLQKLGLKIAPGALKVLDNYAKKDFSFVVSRMEGKKGGPYTDMAQGYPRGSEGANMRWQTDSDRKTDPAPQERGITVSFPAEKIYFPLLPTSVYGSKIIPLSIRVFGLASPELFDGIKTYTRMEYYSGSQWHEHPELKKYFRVLSDFDYTKIDIDAPSKYFTQDLTINRGAPLRIRILNLAGKNTLAIFIILLAINSALAGFFAGPLVYPALRNPQGKRKSAFVGLGNLLSIIGLFICAKRNFKKPEEAPILGALTQLREKGYFLRRRRGFVLLALLILTVMSALYIYLHVTILSGLIILIAGLSMLPSYAVAVDFLHISNPHVLWAITPPVILLLLWIYGIYRYLRIHDEDRPLFKTLKDAGYSTTLFRNGKNMEFAFYFSIFFTLLPALILVISGVEETSYLFRLM